MKEFPLKFQQHESFMKKNFRHLGNVSWKLYITYNITYNITPKILDGMWNIMFEKEIKKVKNRESWTIGIGKNDGEVHEGKCFIYYPHEIEELEQYQSKYETLKKDYNQLNEKYIQSHETTKSLREDVTKQTETINQLNSQIDDMEGELKSISELGRRSRTSNHNSRKPPPKIKNSKPN
jgi:DNA repair exonuclease SbcCD ATPase subunit